MYVVANVAYFKCCYEVLHALKFHIVFYISNFLRNRIIQASINDSLFATFYNTITVRVNVSDLRLVHRTDKYIRNVKYYQQMQP